MNANVSNECAACSHCVGGECRATRGGPEYGDCGHYEGCTGFTPRRAETVREVCAEMNGFEFDNPYLNSDGIIGARILARDWADRIDSAYERELAAKDAEIARLVTDCNRLMAALKPKLEYDWTINLKLEDAWNAVREAQRIIKEGGNEV